MAATNATRKISPTWVRQTRDYVLKVLPTTRFPPVERHGQRGKTFEDPEWLIMLIGVLAVTCKEPTDLGLHRMTCRFWRELCGRTGRLPPISERQLRERFKNIGCQPGKPPGYMFQLFPAEDLGDGGQGREADDQGPGAGLASNPPTTGDHAARLARAGSGGDVE